MDHQSKIDYERLVEDYKKSLTTVLRGFKAGAEFLETWVHDEDDVQSILNILEAAESGGVEGISVYIGPNTLSNLDSIRLKEFATRVGTVETEVNGEGINLNVSFTGSNRPTRELVGEPRIRVQSKSKPIQEGVQSNLGERTRAFAPTPGYSGSVHPVYREGLRKASQFRLHEGLLHREFGVELLRASHEDVLLMVLIEPEHPAGTVKKARYQGPVSDIQRGLLEVLCRIMEGKPILECSDHAAIYLEHELRDHSQPPPVPGIITPENADPVFAVPTLLVRNLMAEYRQRTGFAATVNFYESLPSAQWQALSEDERIRRVKIALDHHQAGRGMEVASLEGLKRIVVKFSGEHDSSTKQRQLIQVENYIKSTIDPALQLYMLPKLDQNKIRRIKGASS